MVGILLIVLVVLVLYFLFSDFSKGMPNSYGFKEDLSKEESDKLKNEAKLAIWITLGLLILCLILFGN